MVDSIVSACIAVGACDWPSTRLISAKEVPDCSFLASSIEMGVAGASPHPTMPSHTSATGHYQNLPLATIEFSIVGVQNDEVKSSTKPKVTWNRRVH